MWILGINLPTTIKVERPRSVRNDARAVAFESSLKSLSSTPLSGKSVVPVVDKNNDDSDAVQKPARCQPVRATQDRTGRVQIRGSRNQTDRD
jgi:hypothetical protein